MSLQGWHRGELAIQRKLAYDNAMSMAWMYIQDFMDGQDRTFHTTRLPFIPVTTLDSQGRPWASILAGASGKPGFVSSPGHTELRIRPKVWEGEPLVANLRSWEERKKLPERLGAPEKFLAAGIGIEFSTRRRNKFAGWITQAQKQGDEEYDLQFHVNQAIGNCPKYINVRDLIPYLDAHAEVVYSNMDIRVPLPDEVISMIHEADTAFLGTSYKARPEDEMRFPSHAGMNQRGGRPGFVRVLPSDKRTIVLPDFSGNRFMTSLGNIETTPLAALTITSFTTGAILYLTGRAQTLVGPPALKIMPRQDVLTTIEVTGAVLVRNALPVRQRPGSKVEPSPYSPLVKLLAEELTVAPGTRLLGEDVQVQLRSVELHSPTLATFRWNLLGSGPGLQIQPGQAAILNLAPLLGKPAYQHMAPMRPSSINDDRVRTWTISSAHVDPTDQRDGTRSFNLTMRLKPGGYVTGALFAIAGKLEQHRADLLEDTRELGIDLPLVGVAGDFTLPSQEALSSSGARFLWIAGGIGVTPFLSMLQGLVQRSAPADVLLILATREPEVLVPLVHRALGDNPPAGLRVRIEVFTSVSAPQQWKNTRIETAWHKGRFVRNFWAELGEETLGGRQVYVCGPGEFEDAVMDGLKGGGMDVSAVKREGFLY
ncbi:hypothetical protein FA95DRAFT_1683589 [Auriscalpium vulgare]|uniref:Uncharacterized protein n=1 Tax=Auriscalpium vulgare TaxID=40419 RepID=A0ACB8R9M6_9AGAM|nr:hypothetical protein FA95DRAFT_1683589 [Auriscalpium vulgare]